MYLGWVCTQPLLERSFSQTKYKYGSAPNLCSRDVSRKQVQVSGPPLAPPFFAGSSFSWKRGIRTKYQVPVQGHAQTCVRLSDVAREQRSSMSFCSQDSLERSCSRIQVSRTSLVPSSEPATSSSSLASRRSWTARACPRPERVGGGITPLLLFPASLIKVSLSPSYFVVVCSRFPPTFPVSCFVHRRQARR